MRSLSGERPRRRALSPARCVWPASGPDSIVSWACRLAPPVRRGVGPPRTRASGGAGAADGADHDGAAGAAGSWVLGISHAGAAGSFHDGAAAGGALGPDTAGASQEAGAGVAPHSEPGGFDALPGESHDGAGVDA